MLDSTSSKLSSIRHKVTSSWVPGVQTRGNRQFIPHGCQNEFSVALTPANFSAKYRAAKKLFTRLKSSLLWRHDEHIRRINSVSVAAEHTVEGGSFAEQYFKVWSEKFRNQSDGSSFFRVNTAKMSSFLYWATEGGYTPSFSFERWSLIWTKNKPFSCSMSLHKRKYTPFWKPKVGI